MAKNGQKAVGMFQENEFDCILRDIQIPVMTGVEAARKIRRLEKEQGSKINRVEKPGYSGIPIIAVTAHTLPDDRENFLEAGMDDYIGKFGEKEIQT